jgi:hypothetical protein
MNRDQKEKSFVEQLARETVKNKDAISEILANSKVGECGGKCKGFKEDDLANLCDQCLQALEKASDKIFSLSVELRLLGDVMNQRS